MGRKRKGDELCLDSQGRLNIQLSGIDAERAIEAMKNWGCESPQEFFRWFSLAWKQGVIPSPFQTSPMVYESQPTKETVVESVIEQSETDLFEIDPGGNDEDAFG